MILKKVIAYIDGFNLYFGLKAKKWQKYYWLDIDKMAKMLLKPDQNLICTKYFTSRITSNNEKQRRQNIYLEAIQTISSVNIYYGKYQLNQKACRKCNNIETIPNEKMTDVNIAVELLSDAFTNSYDIALLVSADSDLVAPIKKVRKLFPEKKIIICFPPERYSTDLKNASEISIHIGRTIFARSQFPEEIEKRDGYILKRPESWK